MSFIKVTTAVGKPGKRAKTVGRPGCEKAHGRPGVPAKRKGGHKGHRRVITTGR
ncbi:hypothetical protein [Streptomyces sp. ODS28]|uniref:hypothetical protein n=1 Tax=Streptomyces sp. ODS28 TaxID=3136688 RepID=UPI0031E5A0AF